MTSYQERKLDESIQENSKMMRRFEEIKRSENYELAPGVEAVKYWIPDVKDSTGYYEKVAFNQWMREMLEYGLKNGSNRVLSVSCPPSLRCVQYLDIDHFTKFGAYVDFHQFINEKVISTIKDTFEDAKIKGYYILTFYPKDIARRCEAQDGGVHIYIVFDDVEKVESIISTMGDRLNKLLGKSFDPAPWNHSTLNLPFSHKAFDSTEYILNLDDCVPSNTTELIEAFHNIPFISHSPIMEETDEALELISKAGGKYEIDDDDFELLKNSFENFTDQIHNYQAKGSTIKDECCLLPLFGAINSLKNFIYRNGIIEAIRSSGKLTESATKHLREHLSDEPTTPLVLLEIIELYASRYYKKNLNKFRALMKSIKEQSIEKYVPAVDYSHALIKRTTIEDIKAIESENEQIDEILGSVRFMCNHSAYLEFIDRSMPRVIKEKQLVDKLKTIFTNNKRIHEVIQHIQTKAYIVDEEISFNLCFSGWAHDREDITQNREDSEDYKRHISKFIEALGNVFTKSETRDYFLHWVNYILHHPGEQTGVLVLIQGRQGTGKTYIVETIAELLRGYDIRNGSMMDLTGRFNIQHFGKNIYIINEIKNANQSERWVYDNLKTKTTENTILYEEKGITTFLGQNSLNIIGISNNARPILPDLTDRRIFNVKSSSLHADDREYWAPFYKLRKEANYYEDICHYIKSLYKEDDDFLSLRVPETQEKVELITAGLSNLNKFIYEHFRLCEAGMTRAEFKELYKAGDYEQKESNMWNDYKNKCSPYKNHNVLYYQLTDEDKQEFNRIYFDIMEHIDNEDEEANTMETEAVNEFAEWIEEHKQTDEGKNKFHYILISTINEKNLQYKTELIKELIAEGWKLDNHLGPNRSKRGYKKMIEETNESEEN